MREVRAELRGELRAELRAELRGGGVVRTSSAISTSFSFAAKRRIDSTAARGSDCPVGLPGLITHSARVVAPPAFAAVSARRSSASWTPHAASSSR